ncbi:hypothetical protein NDA01_00870 [Trichocoleus desertorum AS-A10]|uniref:hypothetical protein n=1 Tax=Trichocoleus desertorum TaxID=1481672 RepID=UPI00329879DF
MLLDADDSSEGISRLELERFWGKELTGLTIAQRKVVIELYRKSKYQVFSAIEIEAQMNQASSAQPEPIEAAASKLA